jgi:pimeloyl-ACP methyl ester carboxylesterase
MEGPVPTIERRGVTIHYTDAGSSAANGPPLVLGHSFLCAGDMWREQLEPLARLTRVVNVDFRGHGRSGHATTPYDLYDVLADVVAVLDRLSIERAVWAGLSMGGMVALRAALRMPARVAGLIVLDSDAGPEGALARFRFRTLGLILRAAGPRPLLPTILRNMFGRTTLATRRELVAEYRERFARGHVASIWHGLGALNGRDSLLPFLGRIGVPTLVIVGEEDAALPPRRSRAIAAGIPRAELRVVPGAGDLACLERPDVVTNAMCEFLSTLARPRQS